MSALKNVIVCGGGALGSHVVYAARGLAADLAVVDFDRVETKNLVSQWFVKPMIGKNKATALKMQFQNFFGRKLHDYTVRLADENVETLLGGRDLVIECFDNAESRLLVQRFVREHGIACIHAGLAADGSFAAVRPDSEFVVDSEDVPGQATCEGDGFLPIITTTAACVVTSARLLLEEERGTAWNVGPEGAEMFEV